MRPKTESEYELGLIEQMRLALVTVPVSGVLGALLGGFVPIATYIVAHQKLNTLQTGVLSYELLRTPAAFLVAGGLLYSAKTVWQWGRLAFEDPWKATGFVLLIEGVMICTDGWLSVSALGYLAVINGSATGCRIALRHVADRLRMKKEARAAATEAELQRLVAPEPRAPELEAGSSDGTRELSEPGLRVVEECDGDSASRSRGDALYAKAVELVFSTGRCSTSAIQRTLKVGYPRAASLVDRMEREGIVGPAPTAGTARLVVTKEPRTQLELVTATAAPQATTGRETQSPRSPLRVSLQV